MGFTVVLKYSKSSSPMALEFDTVGADDGAGVAWRTHSASICHSGSLCVFQNLPPVCTGSPPASGESGCRSKRLFSGSPGAVNWSTTSKFLRDCSSVQEEFPADKGSRRRRVFKTEWQS